MSVNSSKTKILGKIDQDLQVNELVANTEMHEDIPFPIILEERLSTPKIRVATLTLLRPKPQETMVNVSLLAPISVLAMLR